jgi:hypothetical protein
MSLYSYDILVILSLDLHINLVLGGWVPLEHLFAFCYPHFRPLYFSRSLSLL